MEIKHNWLYFLISLLLILVGLGTIAHPIDSLKPEGSKKKFEDVFDIRGYVKNLQTASFIDLKEISTQNFLHGRINTKLYISNSLTAAVELRTRVFYGESIKAQPGFGKTLDKDGGYWNLSSSLVNEDAFVFHSILDRVWLNWSSQKWDVRVGRQRINWGVNLVWNPNDLFNTYNFVDFDYEERPGSDGVRVTRYLKGMSSIEVGGKFSKNPDSTVVAALYKFNKWGYDFQVLSGVYYDDWTLGLGWAGNLKTAGLKGEATYFHPRSNGEDTIGILSTSITLDYSLKKPILLTGSLLYNSAGASDLTGINPALVFSADITAKNLMPSKFSYFTQISGTINPLLTTSLAGIYGAGIDLLFLMPSITYSISDTWDILLLAQVVYVNYQGDFTGVGNAVFIRTKWSF